MTAKEKIQEEKLANILNPKKANSDFKITIRFQKHVSKNFEKALALAKNNKFFLEQGKGNFYKAYASFQPVDAPDLYELFELVKEQETTKIYLNNKEIPYIQDLWLFLMWFHLVR